MLTNHITLDLLSSPSHLSFYPFYSTLYPLPSALSTLSILSSVLLLSFCIISSIGRITGYTFIPCLKPFPTHPCVSGDFSPSVSPIRFLRLSSVVILLICFIFTPSCSSHDPLKIRGPSFTSIRSPNSFTYPVITSSIFDSFSQSSKRNCHHCRYVTSQHSAHRGLSLVSSPPFCPPALPKHSRYALGLVRSCWKSASPLTLLNSAALICSLTTIDHRLNISR